MGSKQLRGLLIPSLQRADRQEDTGVLFLSVAWASARLLDTAIN